MLSFTAGRQWTTRSIISEYSVSCLFCGRLVATFLVLFNHPTPLYTLVSVITNDRLRCHSVPGSERIELSYSVLETDVLPLNQLPILLKSFTVLDLHQGRNELHIAFSKCPNARYIIDSSLLNFTIL